jgi:hypothetical protein
MTVVLLWLGRQALWVGLICLLGALGYVITAATNKRKRDGAQFSLEREVYQQRVARAWMMAALFLALGGVVFMLQAFVLPAVPVTESPTPTLGVGLFTITPAPIGPAGTATPVTPSAPLTATGTITSVVVAVPQPTPTEILEPTPTPVPQNVYQPDCPSPSAQLTLPTAGSDLSGEVSVEGTARVNAFSFYKFEVQFPGSDTPNFVSQYDAAVENSQLGIWDVSDPNRYPPGGPYRFQLVVVDIYGNTTTCTVPVNIVSP